MSKITVNQLRKIIKEELEDMMKHVNLKEKDIKDIDMNTLERLCPAAASGLSMSNLGDAVDHNDMFWVITEKPEMISDGGNDGDYGREEWTQTNEPELGYELSENWDSVACDVKGKKIVFLCGSHDDEYGYYWDNSDQEWVSYNY
jgi:hypothetical protein